jgi:hypothetical protein
MSILRRLVSAEARTVQDERRIAELETRVTNLEQELALYRECDKNPTPARLLREPARENVEYKKR